MRDLLCAWTFVLVVLVMVVVEVARVGADPVPPFSVSVMDYGAKGDGKSDDTAAFAAALAAASSNGGSMVTVPPATFLLAGQLLIPPGVALQGTFVGPPRSYDVGSKLLTTFGHNNASAGPFIKLSADSAVSGLIIFYPLQTMPPVPYGPTLQQTADSPTIRNMFIVNPWFALDLGTITGGRHFVENVWGQPLSLGLFIDNCYDVGRVTNIHWWPFWQVTSQAMNYTAHNAVAFRLGRSDWQMIHNCFSIAYSIGWHFFPSSAQNGGNGGNYLITNSGSDEPGMPIFVERAWPMQGITFVNSQFMGETSVIAAGNTGPVKFTACAFVGNPRGNMGFNGTDSIFSIQGGSAFFSQSTFLWFGQENSQAPAIDVESGGRASITTCEFRDSGKKVQAQFADGARGAFALNHCNGGCTVLGALQPDVQMALNVDYVS